MIRFTTAASAMALCAAMAGCEIPRPQYPIRAEAAAPSQAPAPPVPVEVAGPQAAPTAAIQQSSLPPPGARAASPRPGAALERPDRQEGEARLVLAAYDGGVVYPAAAPPEAGVVTLKKGDTLDSLAKRTGFTVEDLAEANDLKPPYRLTAGQSLKLPSKSAPQPKPAADAKASGQVTAAQGDTLASISRKTGVSVADLARINGLKAPYHLKLGQTIRLHEPDAASAPAPESRGKAADRAKAEPEAAAGEGASTVTVRRRETIQSLARRVHVPVAELARLNRLKRPYRLTPGQTIVLPGHPQTAAEAPRAEASRSVKAGRHDTLRTIARKAGVSVEALAALNGLSPPYRIHRGQVIKLPAPGETEAAAFYTVQGGDTLYSIARRFETDPKTLAELNALQPGDSLPVGRRLALPRAAEDRIAPRSGAAASPAPRDSGQGAAPAPLQPNGPVPYSALPANPGAAPPPTSLGPLPGAAAPQNTPLNTPQAAPTPYVRPTQPEASAPSASDAEVAAAGRGLFKLPLHGELLSGFGPKAGGQRNDGVDIAGNTGDPVQAAAAGEVVYAGDSVPGFGNLVLIRHEGGWITAYAHMASLQVKMRQAISQGQTIGQVGQTGGVDRPQLHFEIRYAPTAKDKARPIDPMLVLPPQ